MASNSPSNEVKLGSNKSTLNIDVDKNTSTNGESIMNMDKKILEQVEYYFSDTNILSDDFLLDLVRKDPEGFVDLKIIASFNKMKKLTESTDLIVAALNKSKKLQLSDSKLSVKRIEPVPPKDPLFEKKVVVLSGIPDEEIRKIKQLEAKFSDALNPVKCIKTFPPFQNISKDLKNALTRHRFPEKKFYTIQFEDVEKANAGLRLLRKWWPSAYSNLLSWKSNSKGVPRNGDVNENTQPKPSRKGDPLPLMISSGRPRLKILLPDPNRPVVILTRQPVIPPGEESVGFVANWKENLHISQLAHRPSSDCSVFDQATSTCDFEDPAIVKYVK